MAGAGVTLEAAPPPRVELNLGSSVAQFCAPQKAVVSELAFGKLMRRFHSTPSSLAGNTKYMFFPGQHQCTARRKVGCQA